MRAAHESPDKMGNCLNNALEAKGRTPHGIVADKEKNKQDRRTRDLGAVLRVRIGLHRVHRPHNGLHLRNTDHTGDA